MNRATVVAWQTESVVALTPLVGVVDACRLGRRSRATRHRHTNPRPPRQGPRRKATHSAELSTAEREQVLALFASEHYADLSVNQVWARELDEGRYWCWYHAYVVLDIFSRYLLGLAHRPDSTPGEGPDI